MKSFLKDVLFFISILIITACSPKPYTASNIPPVCDQLPPNVFSSIENQTLLEGSYNDLVSGKLDIKNNHKIIDIYSQEASDSRVRDHLKCLAIHRDGFSQKQADHADKFNAFMSTKPSADQIIDYLKQNPFPNDRLSNNIKQSTTNSNYTKGNIPIINHNGYLEIYVIDENNEIQRLKELYVSTSNNGVPIEYNCLETEKVNVKIERESPRILSVNARLCDPDRYIASKWHEDRGYETVLSNYRIIVNGVSLGPETLDGDKNNINYNAKLVKKGS
ncbi:hypothetical protein [uncultured Desulfuromusa sp.]|uniref:hypothetical protein n=1 Tax=uncultured Desulfuromusa sp. TaxID=219183 RepID=UPI002AA86673|nr:hypothetical protein [uncultured Desulfuromusa sp.]